MPLSDSDSDDSSVSSVASFSEAATPVKKAAASSSPRTSSTFQDSDSDYDINVDDISSDDDSDSDDDGPKFRGGRRPGVTRTKSMDQDEIKATSARGGKRSEPPKRGVARNKSFECDEHMRMRALMGDFRKATSYHKESPKKDKKTIGRSDLNLTQSEESIKKAKEMAEKAKNSLDSSTHELAAMQRKIEEDLALLSSDDNNDVEPLDTVGNFSFSNLKVEKSSDKKEKKEKKKKSDAVQQAQLAQQMRELKREQRLQRARERIEREKDEKEEKERQARLKEKKVDYSEAARRERIYSWYLRLAMPNKETFEEKVSMLPYTAHVSVEDIALLTWNKRETRAFKITDSV